MINLNLWKDALLKPKQTFRKQKKKADLRVATMNVAVAGLISGIITTLAELGLPALMFNIIFYPIAMVVSLLLNSLIYYAFAHFLGGKGDYNTQTHLISLYTAPMSIIGSILIFPLYFMTGESLSIGYTSPLLLIILAFVFFAVYSIYLLVLSLKEAHSFTTKKALLVAILPALILLFLVILGVIAFYGAFSPELESL